MKERRQDGFYWADNTLYRYTPLEPDASWGYGRFEQYWGSGRGWEPVVPSESDFHGMRKVPAEVEAFIRNAPEKMVRSGLLSYEVRKRLYMNPAPR